jgi:hypothetical protein
MERLGETFQPLTDAGTSMFNSLKVGALDFINKALRPMINMLTEAGRMRKLYNAQKNTNDAKIQDMLAGLSSSELPQHQHRVNLAYWDKNINKYQQYLADYKTWQKDKTSVGAYDRMTAFQKETGLSMFSDVKEQLEVFKRQKADYVKLSKDLLTKKVEDNKLEEQSIDSLKKKLQELQAERKKAIEAGDNDLSKSLLKQINLIKNNIKGLGGSTTTTHTKTTAEKIAWDANKTYLAATHATDNMPSVWGMLDEKGRKQIIGTEAKAFDLGKDITEKDYKKLMGLSDVAKENAKSWNDAAGAISAFGSALSSIEDPAAKVMGIVAQAVANIALTFSKSLSGTVTPWDWIAAAATGVTTMISTISAIHSATGYAQGGIVKGNSYSGDNIAAMVGGANGELVGLNAGEVVLSRAQQGNLAAQLQGGGMQNLHLEAVIEAERLRLLLANNGRRTLRGDFVTTNFR